MKKKIWFALCAALLLTVIVIVLVSTQKEQADAPTRPTLPAIREDRDPTEAAPEDGRSDPRQELPVGTGASAPQNPAGTAGEEPHATGPNEAQSAETLPIEVDPIDRNTSETRPAASDPGESKPAAEPESTGETGGFAGFPILPPDIFP